MLIDELLSTDRLVIGNSWVLWLSNALWRMLVSPTLLTISLRVRCNAELLNMSKLLE